MALKSMMIVRRWRQANWVNIFFPGMAGQASNTWLRPAKTGKKNKFTQFHGRHHLTNNNLFNAIQRILKLSKNSKSYSIYCEQHFIIPIVPHHQTFKFTLNDVTFLVSTQFQNPLNGVIKNNECKTMASCKLDNCFFFWYGPVRPIPPGSDRPKTGKKNKFTQIHGRHHLTNNNLSNAIQRILKLSRNLKSYSIYCKRQVITTTLIYIVHYTTTNII